MTNKDKPTYTRVIVAPNLKIVKTKDINLNTNFQAIKYKYYFTLTLPFLVFHLNQTYCFRAWAKLPMCFLFNNNLSKSNRHNFRLTAPIINLSGLHQCVYLLNILFDTNNSLTTKFVFNE